MPTSPPILTLVPVGRPCESVWFLVVLLLFCGRLPVPAAETATPPAPAALDLATPAVITGTFYEIGSNQKKMLFKFRRAASRANDLIRVEQTFAQPDGKIVCRENILYRAGELVSYAMEDLRANIRGSIVVDHGPKKSDSQRVLLDYIENRQSGPKIHKATESLEPNTLICDTIYPEILTRWDDLMQGTVVKFHFISLDPATTLSFRLVKAGETNWQGRAVMDIKMEASNFIVAHWVNPIHFIVEAAPPHRVFSYIGRTTPRILVDGSWEPVDAEAVFDWQ